MILVLTYHKVMPEHAADQDFYTVTPETLEQQLDASSGQRRTTARSTRASTTWDALRIPPDI
jgi:hypothetical protein